MHERPRDVETIAAHAGTRVRVGETISTVGPIDASTTFTYESINSVHAALSPEAAGFAYARNGNPTVVSLETVIAELEGAEGAVAFGSGMAAITTTLLATGLQPGDSIAAARDLYGVTRAAFSVLLDLDVRTSYVDVADLDAVEHVLAETRPRNLYLESIANPLLQVSDLPALVGIAHRYRANVIVDNTFATPCLLRPLELGADIVLHSATKYIAGHGDVLAGVVAANGTWCARIRDRRTVLGGVLSPFEAWLTLRGIRTLPLRVERQSANALELARWLRERVWIKSVFYPGLPDSPHFALAERLFHGRYGGMIAFELDANRDQALAFMDALRLIIPGTSLGDVVSLALYPALSSHRSLSAEERAAAGIGDGLIRLSVGLEGTADLRDDLLQAASAAEISSHSAAVV